MSRRIDGENRRRGGRQEAGRRGWESGFDDVKIRPRNFKKKMSRGICDRRGRLIGKT